MKIRSLEASRGIAAITVVLFHMNAAAAHKGLPLFNWTNALIHGVDFFFVISGFIIFFVHRADIGNPAILRDFMLKRLIRLYPMLWLVACGWMALRVLFHQDVPIAAVGTSLLLYPSMIQPLPDVVWTLRHELVFYLAFGVLIWNRRAGIALFAAWTAGVLAQIALITLGRPVTGIASFFLSSYELDFLCGAGIAYAAQTIKAGRLLLVAGLGMVIAALYVGEVFDFHRTSLMDYTSISSSLWVAVLGVCFAVLLYGIVAVDALHRTPQWLVLLGEASYALYLVHVPLQNILIRLFARLPNVAILILLVVVPVLASLLLHVFLEKPANRWLQHQLVRTKTTRPAI